jgi:hypothetical protein
MRLVQARPNLLSETLGARCVTPVYQTADTPATFLTMAGEERTTTSERSRRFANLRAWDSLAGFFFNCSCRLLSASLN